MSSERAPLLLVVDDEPGILSALRRSLRRESFEVMPAETVDEALRIADAYPVDVVLTDHKMPGMTGLQLLERIAARRPDAILLILTGWTEEIPEESIRRVGVSAVINKPWDDAELKEQLREAAKQIPGARQGGFAAR